MAEEREPLTAPPDVAALLERVRLGRARAAARACNCRACAEDPDYEDARDELLDKLLEMPAGYAGRSAEDWFGTAQCEAQLAEERAATIAALTAERDALVPLVSVTGLVAGPTWKELAESQAATIAALTAERDALSRGIESVALHDARAARDAAIAERDEALAGAERAEHAACATGADLVRIGALCGMTDDEYPLKAVQRVVKERDEARGLLRDAMALVGQYENAVESASRMYHNTQEWGSDKEIEAMFQAVYDERGRIAAHLGRSE